MNDKQITSPIKAIRAKCLDCACTSHEVRLCPVKACPLWDFRFGRNPYRKGREFTDEERRAVAERLAAWRRKMDDEDAEDADE